MEESHQRTRQLIDLALSAGRKFQSPQTGFVQWCFELCEEGEHHTIPIYENFLFALALLRFKSAETVYEALALMDRLLPFQIEETGNFPIYLHQFPKCHRKDQATRLLPVFYWIFKEFDSVIPKEQRQSLHHAVEGLIRHSKEHYKDPKATFTNRLKACTSWIGFGEIWSDEPLKLEGEKGLKELCEESKKSDFGTWFSPQYIGETLVSLQIVYPEGISEGPCKHSWKHFWDHLHLTWDRETCTYCGPAIQEKQWNTEPQSTLYDIAVGYLDNRYNYRCFEPHPFQFEGILVRRFDEPFEDRASKDIHDGEVSGYRYRLEKKGTHSVSFVEKKSTLPPDLEKGFQPFRLLWGDRNEAHTLVCQGGNVYAMDYQSNEGKIDLWFSVDGPFEGGSKEKERELCFFSDRSEQLSIAVKGQKATTFKLNEPIEICGGGVKVEMSFHLEEGSGTFMGHLHPWNRPAQRNTKGSGRFEAFDRGIFLRTVRRNEPCRFRVTLSIVEQE